MSEAIYLIIPGTTKAGTTSLFAYLASHPEICGASLKETGFFLDSEYPNPTRAKPRWQGNLSPYIAYFNSCPDLSFRLEATPGYMYSPGAAARIQAALPHVRLIFIFRNPVQRLLSCYRFAKQIGRIPHQMAFSEYVESQTGGRGEGARLRDLQTGRYSDYLSEYLEVFPRDHIHICMHSEMRGDPNRMMQRIAAWLGVDPGFYKDTEFEIYNPSYTIRFPLLHSLYLKATHSLGQVFMGSYRQRATFLHRLRGIVEPLHLRLTTEPVNEIEMAPDLEQRLDAYYAGELDRLRAMLGEPELSW